MSSNKKPIFFGGGLAGGKPDGKPIHKKGGQVRESVSSRQKGLETRAKNRKLRKKKSR